MRAWSYDSCFSVDGLVRIESADREGRRCDVLNAALGPPTGVEPHCRSHAGVPPVSDRYNAIYFGYHLIRNWSF